MKEKQNTHNLKSNKFDTVVDKCNNNNKNDILWCTKKLYFIVKFAFYTYDDISEIFETAVDVVAVKDY